MRIATPRPVAPPRPAFTLVELVLVLAVAVLLGAMAYPAIQGPLANQRLRSAADEIRGAWLSARADAMTSGEIRLFRYEPEGSQYEVTAWESADAELEASVAADSPLAGGDPARGLNGRRHPRELPVGITFAAGDQQADSRADSLGIGLGVGSSLDGPPAPPVMFYPDGSTSDVQLSLGNEEGRRIHLSLRGLTGVVVVGSPYQQDDR